MSAPPTAAGTTLSTRSRALQLLGIFSGLTAGAWLGAAEAPTNLVTLGLSPMVISLVMVVGVGLQAELDQGQHFPGRVPDLPG